MRSFVLALAFWTFAQAANGDPLQMSSPAPAPEGNFGRAVAIEGNLLAIGQPGGFPNVGDGRVFLYEITPGGPVLRATLLSSAAGLESAGYGVSLAIQNGRLLVGAPWATRVSDGQDQHGAVAVYSFTGVWQNVTLTTVIGDGRALNVSIPGQDWFGFDVELAGNILAVASVNANGAAGKVDLYRINGAFSSLTHLTTIGPELGLTANAAFGHAVAIEGARLAIGSDKDDAGGAADTEYGAVYLFNLNTTTGAVIHTGVLRHNAGIVLEPRDFFGASIDIDNGRVFIGAPGDDGPTSDYYERGTGGTYMFDAFGVQQAVIGLHRPIPIPQLQRFDMSGYFVDADGTRLVIGAPQAAALVGQVYLMSTP